MQRIKCVLCGSIDYIPLLQAKDYRLHTTEQVFGLVRCLRCGVVYLNPRPSGVELAKFYPEAFYAGTNVMSKFVCDFLNRLKFREVDHFKKSGRILDVGCGDGSLLFAFKARGWETSGVDTSEKACRLSVKTLGGNVYNCALKACSFPDSYFDVVFLNHVIEHMSCPNEELVEISRILKDDGVVFVRTPNVDSYQFGVTGDKWLHLDVPRHLVFYSPNTISLLLRNSGLEVVKITFPLFDFPFDFYFGLKLKLASMSCLLDFILSPILRVISLTVKLLPAWRGSMAVVAVKKPSIIYTPEGVSYS
jgi:SAM-dependent methyltransferase